MLTQLPLPAFLSSLSALITLMAAIAAWRRPAPGSSALSLLLLAMGVWSGCYASRWMNIAFEAKLFLFKVMFISIALIPALFLVFALGFTCNKAWFKNRNLAILFILPSVSLFLQWTNAQHLFYRSLAATEQNGLLILEIVRGPWYFVNVAYSYTVIGISIYLMSQSASRAGPLYRYQYRLVLLASFLPWGGNIFKELNFKSSSNLDMAPMIFGLSGIIFVFAVLRTHFMDLIPVARSHLIENMSDGILVLDAQHRIVDINRAMENFIVGNVSFYLGKSALDVLQPWLENGDIFLDAGETRAEMKVPIDPSRYLDLCVTPLYDRAQVLSGRLMVFRDITERKQVEKRLRYVNDKLQGQLIEIGLLQSKLRQQAIRDPLTNLFNRRYLEETLDRELSRAARESYSVCVIMIDLDHFKKINDTYGHEAGDLVLKGVADLLSEQTRRGDFACRYGGEEFVITMPNISMDIACERAESLRQCLIQLRMPYQCHSLSVTISIGIASYPENGQTRESILRAADQAMYAAKEAGRDHILSYDQILLSADALDE